MGFLFPRKYLGDIGASYGVGSKKKNFASAHETIDDFCQKMIAARQPGSKFLKAMVSKEDIFDPLDTLFEYPIVFESRQTNIATHRVVVFGDSLSDTGNLKNWLKVFPAQPYFLGRFSDGLIWTDYLENFGKVTVQNWAYGGATSEPLAERSSAEIIEYIKEGGRNFVTGSTRNFIDHYIKSYLFDGKLQNADKTLFIVWAGANDYGSKFDLDADLINLIDDPNNGNLKAITIEKSTAAIANQVQMLYNVGARNFVVGNLPNLGVVPLVANNQVYKAPNTTVEDLYHLSVKSTEMVFEHNRVLAEKIDALRSRLPGAKVVVFDVFDALEKMLISRSPDAMSDYNYGFNLEGSMEIPLTKSGQPTILGNRNCYTGGYLGPGLTSYPKDVTCPQFKRAMFYDMVHPTTFTHCWLSYFMQRAIYEGGFSAALPGVEDYQAICGAAK